MAKSNDRPGTPDDSADMFRVLIALIGRIAFPEEVLRDIVGGKGKAAPKYIAGYNLCDGQTMLSEIAQKVALDRADLSKAVTRWVAAGVVYRIGADGKPFKLYGLRVPDEPEAGSSRAKRQASGTSHTSDSSMTEETIP